MHRQVRDFHKSKIGEKYVASNIVTRRERVKSVCLHLSFKEGCKCSLGHPIHFCNGVIQVHSSSPLINIFYLLQF